MNEKQAKRLRREAKKTYGVSEVTDKYIRLFNGSIRLVGVKAIYKQAKRTNDVGNLCTR